MRTLQIPTLAGVVTSEPTPKMWDGAQSLDSDGRPLVVVPVLIGDDVARVSVPAASVPAKLAPMTPVTLDGVIVGAGKSGLWVSAMAVTTVTK